MLSRRQCPWSFLILLGIGMGCSRSQPAAQANKGPDDQPQIVVTNEPLLQMTKALIGAHAKVVRVVPVGTVLRDWSPTPADARVMQQAGLILINGAGYEPWKDRVSLPGSRTFDTAAGYYDQFIRIPDAVTHQHGPEGAHSHPGTVWATWLDPELCMAQLRQVSIHCSRLVPEQKQAIEEAAARLSAELNSLNPLMDSIKAAVGQAELVVYSDAPHYQYLTRRLGWTLNSLHWDVADQLSDANREELLHAFSANKNTTRAREGSRLFFLDSRHSAETEDFVRTSGGTVIRIDLCETPASDSTSFPDRLKQNLQRIRDAIEESSGPREP